MKVCMIISMAIIFFGSFVISSDESAVKFFEVVENKINLAIDEHSFFEKIVKNEEHVLEFVKNNINNKFVRMLRFQQDAKSVDFECENVNSFLNRYDEEIFTNLSNCLNFHLDSPITLDILNFILLKIQKTAQSNRLISIIKIGYTDKENLQFLEILVNQHTSSKLKLNLMKLSNPELKNDKIFLYKADDDKNYYYAESLKDLPEQNQAEELSVFMTYLEILSENKIRKQSSTKPRIFNPQIFVASEESTSFLEQAFQTIKGGWGLLLYRFQNSRETVTKKLLSEKGFSSYDQSAQVQILGGMKRQGLKHFYDLIEKRLNVPEDKRSYISDILETVEWSDTNTWANFDIAFSIDDGAKVKFASIFSNRGPNDTFNFVITEVDATFELAPDLVIVTQKLSILGGLWSQQTFEVQKVPRNVSQEDIENVFNFFQLIIYKQVATQFGINLELPK